MIRKVVNSLCGTVTLSYNWEEELNSDIFECFEQVVKVDVFGITTTIVLSVPNP